VSGFLTGASFNTGIGGVGVRWSGSKFSTDSRIFYLDAVNDFPFTNTNVSPAKVERRDHAGYRRFGIMHRDYWMPAKNWLVQLEGWLQDNHTQLPNSTSVLRESQATQEDDFLRAMIAVQYTPGPLHVSLRSAIQRQRLDYRDPLIGLTALSGFTSSINNVEATWFANPSLELTTGINTTYESSSADDYEVGTADRTRVAVFGASKFKYNTLIGTLSARQEIVEGDLMPFAPAIGGEYILSQAIRLTGNVSRSYRIPTMNDLYWSSFGASGNPDLVAEESWNEEAAIHFQSKPGNTAGLTWTTTAFSSQVDDWILWRYEALVWMPENIKKVWSRGSESKITARWVLADIQTAITGLYSFTKSTNSTEPQEGRQLVFTPLHEGSLTLKADWNKWGLVVTGNITGKQYTDDDNSESFAMDSYATLNVWICRDIGKGNPFRGKFIAEVNNILDMPYESRPGYPMPGRNFRLSFNFNIYKPVSK
jgi:vitamin B12 transporter